MALWPIAINYEYEAHLPFDLLFFEESILLRVMLLLDQLAFSEMADTDEIPSERDTLLLGTRGLLVLWYTHGHGRQHERESVWMKHLAYLVLNDIGLSTLFRGMDISSDTTILGRVCFTNSQTFNGTISTKV